MLKSGAHVSIDGNEFYIAEHIDPASRFVHSYADPQTFFSTQEGTANGTADNTYHQVRVWWMQDFSGGEGATFWGTDADTNQYDQGALNPRMPFSLSPRPSASGSSVTPTLHDSHSVPCTLYMGVGGGLLWLASEHSLWSSADGVTWTSRSSALSGAVSGVLSGTKWHPTAITGDHDYMYLALSDAQQTITGTSYMGNTGIGVVTGASAQIVRFDSAATATTIVRNRTGTTGEGGGPPWVGLGVNSGFLVAWNGWAVYTFPTTNLDSNYPITFSSTTKITDPQYRPFRNQGGPNVAGIQTAGACNVDDGLVMFASDHGHTQAWYFQNSAPPTWIPLYALPDGFACQSVAYHSGLAFFSGTYQGRAAAYVVRLGTLETAFLGYIRPWVPGYVVTSAGTIGSQTMFLHSTFGVFLYDHQENAITRLDGLNSGQDVNLPAQGPGVTGIGAFASFRGYRYAAYPSSTNINIVQWDQDNKFRSETNALHYSPAWDFGYSALKKTLLGVELQHSKLLTGDSIYVDYIKDETGLYTQYNDGSDVAGTGPTWASGAGATTTGTTRTWLDLTGQGVTLNRLRLRLKVSGSPRIFTVAPKVYIAPGQETFKVALRLYDEESGGGFERSSRRPVNLQRAAETMRAALWTSIRKKTPVTFLDGYSYKKDLARYDTYTVVLEEIGDTIETLAQGYMIVTLRVVSDASLI